VAERAGINPYQREYYEAVRYLIDNGYVEPYPHPSHGLYRMTNKVNRRAARQLLRAR
jgi:hypothetical protein